MLEGKTFQPIHDRLLIRMHREEETERGIYLPEQSQKVNVWGTVLAVGEKVLNVKEGDVVMIGKLAGTRILVNSRSHIIAKEREILAKEADSEKIDIGKLDL